MSPPRTVVVGSGRAGTAFSSALGRRNWQVAVLHHTDLRDPPSAPDPLTRAELVLLCVPDAAVREVAGALGAEDSRVVAHCAGSLGLDALGGHPRIASVHPLVSLPGGPTGADRLGGAWFAVAGDPVARVVVDALDGHAIEVPDGCRPAYHAAAVVASNHLVALLAQVERLAATAGVPLSAYMDLARGTLDNVAQLGPAGALTGPVSRGDWQTVRRHLAALDPSEREEYLALAAAAARLAGRQLPASLHPAQPGPPERG